MITLLISSYDVSKSQEPPSSSTKTKSIIGQAFERRWIKHILFCSLKNIGQCRLKIFEAKNKPTSPACTFLILLFCLESVIPPHIFRRHKIKNPQAFIAWGFSVVLIIEL